MSDELSERERALFDLIMQGVKDRYGQTFDCSGAVVTRAVSVARALSDGMILDVDVGGVGYRPAADAADHGGGRAMIVYVDGQELRHGC